MLKDVTEKDALFDLYCRLSKYEGVGDRGAAGGGRDASVLEFLAQDGTVCAAAPAHAKGIIVCVAKAEKELVAAIKHKFEQQPGYATLNPKP